MTGLTLETGNTVVDWFTDGKPISVEVARNIAATWQQTDGDAFAVFAATGTIGGDLMEAIRLAWVDENDDQVALALEALAAHVRSITTPDEPILTADTARDWLVSQAPVR